jgi:outer membrane protein assembly factor BamB
MHMLGKLAVRFFSLVLILVLTACGGGGGESKPSPPSPIPPKVSLTGTPLTSINEMQAYTFQVVAKNASSSNLSFSIENLPTWGTFDTTTGVLSGTPSFEDAALYQDIKISVADGVNSASLAIFSIDVINVNRLPVITVSTSFEFLEAEDIAITFSVMDTDLDAIAVSIENPPDWLNIDTESDRIVGKASLNDAGSYAFYIIIDDGHGEIVKQEVSLLIKDALEVRGKVIDGYIQGAVVYLDENLNVILDENEFSAVTNDNGEYVLVLPVSKLDELSVSPLRAYLGEAATDISRPELDFSSTPITLSFPPLDISLVSEDILGEVMISPFSDKLFDMVSVEINKVLTSELSIEELRFYINRAKGLITQEVIVEGGITLTATNNEAFINSVIFGDFIQYTDSLGVIHEQAENQIDLRLSHHEAADFDGDGIANDVDTDDDGDNVEDSQDAFPFDATEWLDSDGDGVGDNADFYPNNASCFTENDGNGETCFVNTLVNDDALLLTISSAEIAYFYQQDGMLITYDLVSQHTINSQQVDGVTSMIFHEGHQRLYLGLASQELKYLTDDFSLADFVTGEQCVNALVDADSFLIVLDCNGYAGTYTTFNRDGELLDNSENYYDSSRANAWNSTSNRLYHFRDGISPNDLFYRTINGSGEFIEVKESPYHGDYSIAAPIVISNDGSKVLLGSGDIYDANTLIWLQSTSERFAQGFWLDNGELITLSQKNEKIVLKRRDVDFDVVELKEIDGSLLAVKSFTDKAMLIVEHGERIDVVDYLPSNDSDNDGVINIEDAFPLDSSASLDTDFDGYPDSWNEGYSANNNALMIDEFPLDSACWLTSHGNENGCDVMSTQPNFTPDRTVYDNAGNIYFLSTINKRIYRWSAATNQFTNPVVLSSSIFHDFGTSQVMTYSAEHNRIYIGYDSGVVSRFNIDEWQEIAFANLGRSVNGIGAVGKFILAENENGAWNTHYIIDEFGEITDSKDWNRSSPSYIWNETDSRVYSIEFGNLHYQTIDQSLGHITSEGEIRNSIGVSHPLNISPNGKYLISSNGGLFDLEANASIVDVQLSAVDIISTSEFILSIEREGENTKLKIWQLSDFVLQASIDIVGAPVGLALIGDDVNVITLSSSGALNVSVVGIVDNDEDGIPLWWESLYNFDDNDASDAILDSDTDGLTNLEEYNLKTDPLMADTDGDGLLDGAEVNEHGTLPLDADTDQDGLSDGIEVNEHGTNPLSSDSDNDGLTDSQEVLEYQSNPLSSDTDGDGLSDLYEVNNQLDINVNDANEDNDNDGLVNIDELTQQTDPNKPDTDNDELNDGDEVHIHFTLPLNRDSDNDKMPDGWEVRYAFDPLSNTDGEVDFDEDSYANYIEFFLETDPTDINDIPVPKLWDSYQGNADHSGFSAININPDNLSLRWAVNLPSVNQLNPVVASDGKVFVTNNARFDDQFAFAVNAANGGISWQKSYGSVHSINAPALNDGNVYFQTREEGGAYLHAVNGENGDSIFTASYGNQWERYQAPTPFDGDIYVAGGTYGGSYKFDGLTGEELWFQNLNQCDGWTPAVDNEHVYYFSNGFVIADKSSGDAFEKNEDVNISCKTPILAGNNTALVISSDDLYAFDTQTADKIWSIESDDYNNRFLAAPSAALGKVYVNKAGELTVFDQFTGEELWNWRPQNNNIIQGNIVLTLNLAFVQDSINTYAIDLNTHEQVWSYPVSGQVSLSLEGALYITGVNGLLTAIDFGADTDEDGMDDWWEDLYGLDSQDASDALLNADNDELTNLEEFQNSTDPTSDDSDNDGLSDSDEVNVHLSNPLNTDTDNDGMADGWEVTHGLDLLSDEDVLLDADNDGISNIDEFIEGTDPTDENSMPEVIEELNISFETGVIPDDWTIDNSAASSWGVSSLESSDGDYSIFSSGQAEISFSGYFNGNNVKVEFKAQCQNNVYFAVYIDGEEIASSNSSGGWHTKEFSIPRGRHSVAFKTNNCGAYIDNLRFSPLLSLFDLNIETVTVANQNLHYYDFEQQLVQSVEIPRTDSNARDLTILDDGRIAVFNGVFEPMLSIYNPLHATWHHRSFSDWGIVNNGTYGGIAHSGDYIFVTDMSISGNTTAGVIRFNIARNDAEFFAGGEYIDLTVGLDDMLYALSGRQVDKYDPITMELLASITITEARAIAVDVDSNLYTASWNGTVKRYSATGVENQLLELRDFYDNASGSFYDMNIFENSSLLLTNRSSEVFVLESDFSQLIRQNDNFRGAFIATVPFVDADADGMPKWWEEKFGLSDENELDAQEDMDGEGLINLSEYLHNTNPSVQDTDDDLLNDFVELNDHETDPRISDTDKDNLSDGDEIFTHLTDPLLIDSDGDSFNDGDEVLLYETDPNDELSKPDSITELNIDFSTTELSEHWVEPESSDGSWLLENEMLRSGVISHSQRSQISYQNVFSAGTLNFDTLLDSESCCDYLEVYLDDVKLLTINTQAWQANQLVISAGAHNIKFIYQKDSSVNSGEDAAFIDNVVFSVN